ncbi:hypothetical protein [Aestuariivirga sp.]|uniref:hypothetical protein n=1 Tax=Aestuariivirga sp. TaxID=2650926 RepID=UPI0035AF79FC
MAALRKLSPKELRDFSTVMSVIGDVLVGFSCQPRFFQNGGMRLNGAGELMETVADLVTGYRQAAYNVAKASTPTDSDGVEWRGWTLLGFETDMADDLAALAVTAAETVRDESEARFREQHR